MSGTLYLVATPIGNLEDITLRALRVLREVNVIAAEDTRRTGQLLAHFGIEARMVSCHQHNVRTRVPELVARLKGGDSVAVVTDAGTPAMSDPGVELVQACIEAGIAVDAIPGPHAGLTALVLSGFPTDQVTVLGFGPSRGNARTEWIVRVLAHRQTVVLFESPHRVRPLVLAIQEYSPERPIMLARELTKVHQTLYRGTAREVLQDLDVVKGEFTVVLGPVVPEQAEGAALTPAQARAEFGEITNNCPTDRRSAVVELARRHGLRPRDVYELLEQSKVMSNA